MVNRVIHGRGSPQVPMRLESWRGCRRQFSVDAEKDDGELLTVHPVFRARIC